MVSVSQERWQTAQKAEKHAFNHCPVQKSPVNNDFFSQNFSIGAEFFCSKSVLEVGCSPVATIHSIKKTQFTVGIDPLANEWARFYEKNTGHIQGMGECLPLKNECFNVVLCINALDHVQIPSDTLKEIRRCLKEKGNMILWLQTFSTFKIVRKLLGSIDTPHPHHFSDGDVLSLLKDIGYHVDYHHCRKASIHSAISVIKVGLFVSGLKSLLAHLLLGLHESSFLCSKAVQNEYE